MRAFLMLVGVAAVAGAMYAAGASGGRPAKFASQREVVALRRDLKKVQTELKAVKSAAYTANHIIGLCYFGANGQGTGPVVPVALGASQFGDATSGFLFGTNGATAAPRTALDVDESTPMVYLQTVNPECHPISPAPRHALTRWGHGSLPSIGGSIR